MPHRISYFAQMCHNIYNKAYKHFQDNQLEHARQDSLTLVTDPTAPRLVRTRAWQLLSRITPHHFCAKEYLENAMALCKKMEQISMDDAVRKAMDITEQMLVELNATQGPSESHGAEEDVEKASDATKAKEQPDPVEDIEEDVWRLYIDEHPELFDYEREQAADDAETLRKGPEHMTLQRIRGISPGAEEPWKKTGGRAILEPPSPKSEKAPESPASEE